MTEKYYYIMNTHKLTEKIESPPNTVFVIGDLHLNHENIIQYCHRPFESVDEMNKTLIDNWNFVVKKTDYVFFLGDMGIGCSDTLCDHTLNGQILFVKGNHDRKSYANTMYDQLEYKYKDIHFRFIHNPDKVSDDSFEGWTIHGHHHNNWPTKYPLFDPENRKINVSVENIRYQPYPLDAIVELIKSDHKRIISL